jgi:hypothetical protein
VNTQQPIDFSNHKQHLDSINERVMRIAHWDEAAVIYLEPETDDAHLWYAAEDFIAEVPRMVRGKWWKQSAPSFTSTKVGPWPGFWIGEWASAFTRQESHQPDSDAGRLPIRMDPRSPEGKVVPQPLPMTT